MSNVEIVNNIKQCVVNARVDLEQGGKYEWNDDLQSCDNWLQNVVELLDKIK